MQFESHLAIDQTPTICLVKWGPLTLLLGLGVARVYSSQISSVLNATNILLQFFESDELKSKKKGEQSESEFVTWYSKNPVISQSSTLKFPQCVTFLCRPRGLSAYTSIYIHKYTYIFFLVKVKKCKIDAVQLLASNSCNFCLDAWLSKQVGKQGVNLTFLDHSLHHSLNGTSLMSFPVHMPFSLDIGHTHCMQ